MLKNRRPPLYVPKYAELAAPLFELTRKRKTFEVAPEHLERIDKIKTILQKRCLLTHFRQDRPTRLQVDASGLAVGGFLEQMDETEGWNAIHYFSQRLKNYQMRYTASEKECLAVVLIVTKFRHFLEGKEFTIVTDHHALCALPKANFKSSRLQNWAIILSQFKYRVEYSAGKHHPADCLSRYQSEWDHRKMIEEDELLDSCLRVSPEKPDPIDQLELEESDTEDGGMLAVLEDHIRQKFGYPDNWCIRYIRCRYNKRVSAALQRAQNEDREVQEIKSILESHSRIAKKYQMIGETLFRKETTNRPYLRIYLPN